MTRMSWEMQKMGSVFAKPVGATSFMGLMRLMGGAINALRLKFSFWVGPDPSTHKSHGSH